MDGRLLVAAVSPANLHGSHGGVVLLRASSTLWPLLTHCFANRAYQGAHIDSAADITVEVVLPKECKYGFTVSRGAG